METLNYLEKVLFLKINLVKIRIDKMDNDNMEIDNMDNDNMETVVGYIIYTISTKICQMNSNDVICRLDNPIYASICENANVQERVTSRMKKYGYQVFFTTSKRSNHESRVLVHVIKSIE